MHRLMLRENLLRPEVEGVDHQEPEVGLQVVHLNFQALYTHMYILYRMYKFITTYLYPYWILRSILRMPVP